MRKAVDNVTQSIGPLLNGRDPRAHGAVDLAMIELDGSAKKTELGANAILGVSMAVARAAALSCDVPLYAYLGGVGAVHVPIPMMNVLNGVFGSIPEGQYPAVGNFTDSIVITVNF